jgi:hypothetical protein
MKSYYLSNQTKNTADVYTQNGKLLGHVKETLINDVDKEWCCFLPGHVYINTGTARSAEQAGLRLMEYLNKHKKRK